MVSSCTDHAPVGAETTSSRGRAPATRSSWPQQEAAVVAVDAERVVAVERHVAVGLADEERVAGLQDDGVGEVNRSRAHAPRSGGTAAAAPTRRGGG